MYELQQTIYTALSSNPEFTGATGLRIYHKHLPASFKTNQINTVFILNTSGTDGSFDCSDEISEISLNIKLNYFRSAELYSLIPIVKNIILNLNEDKIKYVEYSGDDLVHNPNLDFYNLNLRFNIHLEK